jgi:hypothetical protein
MESISLQGFHLQSIFRTFEMFQRFQLGLDNNLIIKILPRFGQSAQARISWPACDASGCHQKQQLFRTLYAEYLSIGVWHNALMSVKTRFCPARKIDFAEGVATFQNNRLDVVA